MLKVSNYFFIFKVKCLYFKDGVLLRLPTSSVEMVEREI